ncbi:MAG TPA: PQQ-dependent sugar dehydrogenase [Solirubrobacteraceae bacterium]|nr:PQQ-dependent sugar dehydrogenase [Solirubrobacteraceae bacterium]
MSAGWLVLIALSAAFVVGATPAAAATLPSGFREVVALDGLTLPTTVRFAPDGRVFVAEKSGLVKVFDSLADGTPTVFADLRTKVHNFHDRGLLGLELDPSFPAKPYVYVLYTHDAAIGGTAPRWGTAGATFDDCPTPPGPTADGCVVSGRLSRLQAAGNVATGAEKVLIEDWCNQYPSHTIGSLAFGADGYLYVSGGDGASFNVVDWGQDGSPRNPCGDPPGGPGSALAPPTAEGGALRSQDVRTLGDPTGLDGTLLRVDPATGAGAPDNPHAASSDPNLRRIVAAGLRNPFRIAIRPGTNEIWVAEVGWNTWEEINRVPAAPGDADIDNFGWPCYEGHARQGGYDSANLDICESLYVQPGAVAAPYFAYKHDVKVVPGEGCPAGNGSSPAGVRFYAGGPYPDDYDGALFFADFSRGCIWVMKRAGGTLPSPAAVSTFVDGAAGPVDLLVGPSGELFYVDILDGQLRRIEYQTGNAAPVAIANATPRAGATPLVVGFDSAGSGDPDGDPVTLAWDLDGDGAYDDSTAPAPAYTYATAGAHVASLQVTDSHGTSSRASVTIVAGDTPPRPVIASPAEGTTWKVGDAIAFAGSAGDTEDGTLPAKAMSWSLRLHHCSGTGCHVHPVQTYEETAGGSFVAADHAWPAYLELVLTATDSHGVSASTSRRLDPRTVTLTMRTNAAGLKLALNGEVLTTPFSRTVIQGSNNTVSAPTPQTVASRTWAFLLWSDLGAQTHNVTANANRALSALFVCRSPSLLCTLL